MGNELAVQAQDRLIVVPKYSNDQIALLADTIAKGCTENELKLFLEISKLTRLNPFTGQIRPVKRWDSGLGREAMVIQTGIDGFRAMASRTSDHAGTDDAVFDSETEKYPKWAKVTVYRWSHGEKVPYTATARWSEYVQTKKGGEVNSMWNRMPYLMLAKCAEALALRKAFPDELAGIYTEEEMMQADNPEVEGEKKEEKKPVTQPTRASEKKAEAQVVLEEVSGKIESIKDGKDGDVWLTIPGHLVLVRAAKVNDDMKPGAFLSADTRKMNHAKLGDYWLLENLKECSPAQDDIAEGEIVGDGSAEESDDPTTKDYGFGDKAETAKAAVAESPVLKDLVTSGAIKSGSSISETTMSKKEQSWKAHVGHDPAVHISVKQDALIYRIQTGRKLTDETIKGLMEEQFGVGHRYHLAKEDFPAFLDMIDPNFEYHEKKK